MAATKAPAGSLCDLPPVALISELADVLRVDPRTLRNSCEAGEVPGAFRVGQSWRVNVDTLRRELGDEPIDPDGRLYGGMTRDTDSGVR